MTLANRVGVIKDAQLLDNAARVANEQAELARQRRLELEGAASDLNTKKQQVDQAVAGVPAQVQALAATTLGTLQTAANTALERSNLAGAVGTDAELAGRPAGQYRVGRELVQWNGNSVTSRTPALATAQETADARALADTASEQAQALTTSLARLSVDAAAYGVAEGADVSTFMAAVAATPDGGTLVCPPDGVNLRHLGGRLIIANRRINIEGRGLRVTAAPTLPDTPQNGGFYLIGVLGRLSGITYDGRLDARTPAGSDLADTNLKSGWNILNDCDVELVDIVGERCMMDGIYVGHVDNTMPDVFPGANVNQANMPRATLTRSGGRGCYRQGISAVGVNRLTGTGNFGFDTGKTGGKFTLPAAGIDLEASLDNGWYNLGVDLKDTVVDGNRGHGLLIENGTRGAILDGVRGSGNGGGIAFAATSQDCTVYLTELTGGGTDPAEPVNIVVRGQNNHVYGGTVRCPSGSRGGTVLGVDNGIHDTTVYAAQGGMAGTASVLGDDVRAVIENVTVVDGVALPGYGVIDNRSLNGRTVRPTLSRSGGADASSVPVKITSGTLELPSVAGYTQAVAADVPGQPLAGTPDLAIQYAAGRALSEYSPAGLAFTSEVIDRRPDVTIMRARWQAVWDAGAAAQAQFALSVAGRAVRVLSAQAYNPDLAEGAMGAAVIKPDQQHIVVAGVPGATFYIMRYLADVEVRRA